MSNKADFVKMMSSSFIIYIVQKKKKNYKDKRVEKEMLINLKSFLINSLSAEPPGIEPCTSSKCLGLIKQTSHHQPANKLLRGKQLEQITWIAAHPGQ